MATLVISRPSLEAALCNIRTWRQTKPGIGIFLEFFNNETGYHPALPFSKTGWGLEKFQFSHVKTENCSIVKAKII